MNNILILNSSNEYTTTDKFLYLTSDFIAKAIRIKKGLMIDYPPSFIIAPKSHKVIKDFIRKCTLILDYKFNDDKKIKNSIVYICVVGNEADSIDYIENLSNYSMIKYDLIITKNKKHFHTLNQHIKNKTKVILCENYFNNKMTIDDRFIKIINLFAINGKENILNSLLRIGSNYNDLTKYAIYHNYYSYLGLIRRALILKNIKLKTAHNLSKFRQNFLNTVFSLLPINKKLIVIRAFQNSYSCNPKYICNELLSRKRKYKIVWITNLKGNSLNEFPTDIIISKPNSLKTWFYLCTAKIIIDNNVRKILPKFRKNRLFIQTWHGSLGIKKFGNVWSTKTMSQANKFTSYIISNSNFEDYVYKSSIWKSTPILKIGHPRNDIFFYDFKSLLKIKQSIYERYNIDTKYKTVLYAPTFRNQHLYGSQAEKQNISMYITEFNKLLETLENKFNSKFVLLLRLHPHLKNKIKLSNAGNNVIDVSTYPDIQELMIASDVGITDYSSWIYDYILSDKPAFIYIGQDNYEDERELYYPLAETPFSVSTTEEELLMNISEFNYLEYKKKVKAFLNKMGCVDDGLSSVKLVNLINNIIQE